MIEVKKLVKFYGSYKVLCELDFTVEPGHICGFLGPNGSGKSTTMDILAGLLGPSSGEAYICGTNVLNSPEEAKKNIGYLPDNPPLYEEMFVREFIEYVAKIRNIKPNLIKEKVTKAIDDCDIADVQKRIIGHLSKGYKQRVALCAALVHEPKVLVLDEPTEGLDPLQIVHIRKLIKKLGKDRTVILSSHILSEVEEICDDVIIINKGQIVTKTSINRNEAPKYTFSFAHNINNVLVWLSTRSFVKEVKINTLKNDSLIVDFSKDFWQESTPANIAKVVEQLVKEGFALIELTSHQNELERVFFEAINLNTIQKNTENSLGDTNSVLTQKDNGSDSANVSTNAQ